jgi:hypothetical protein
MACSLTKKEMIYCPYGSSKTIEDKAIIDKLSKLSIGDYYANLCQAADKLTQSESTNIY